MKRKSINPWSWSTALGFDQGQLIEQPQHLLICSGQDAVNSNGDPQYPDDMMAQLKLALDNVEAILADVEMTFANIVRITVYTTDVDEFFKHWESLTSRFGASSRFTTSIVGVTRLAAPNLKVLLEVTAID